MSQPPEILVHISAPSRLSDDSRYRAQLRGLLGFESVRRHVITAKDKGSLSECTTREAEEDDYDFRCAPDHPDAEEEEDQADRGSPYLIPRSTRSIPPTSSSSNPSDHTTTSHVPETTLKAPSHIHIIRTPFPTLRPDPALHGLSAGIYETPILPNTDTSSWATLPCIIPDSQPTPPNAKRPLDFSSRSPNAKRRLASSSPSPTHTSSPTIKRSRILPPPQPLIPHPLLPPSRSSSPLPPLTSPPLPPASSPSLFRPSTLIIHPPRAPISTQPFHTYLTRDLSALAAQPQLQNYYTAQIRTQTRPLGVQERGHWVVPLGGLGEEERGVLWEFLGRFVGGGKAGWGVWCVLEGVDGGQVGGVGGVWMDGLVLEDMEDEQEEVLKVYCWGEIVGEIWNVIFLGTGKKVRGSGTRWVGVQERDGEVVAEVVVWMK